MTVTTDENGVQNLYHKEPQVSYELKDPKYPSPYVTIGQIGEQMNGRLAMVGFVAAIGSYLVTGDIIPGLLWLMTDFQLAVFFPYIVFFLVFGVLYAAGLISGPDDHDDDWPDDGMMIPAYAPTS